MKQALHILKKDARYLRWELCILFLLMAIFVYSQVTSGITGIYRPAIMTFLLLAYWAFLCARLVQAEPIPGDRQFWITRPYEWRSLLGAKLMFMLVCIAIPLLAADALILGLAGFSAAAHAGGLLWSMLLIVASTLLAFCAFATLSCGLVEWMLGAIVTAAALYALDTIAAGTPWNGVEWIREYTYTAIMCASAALVLVSQYRSRRTLFSIVVMAAGVLGATLYTNYATPSLALEMETRFSKPEVDPSALQISVIAPPDTGSQPGTFRLQGRQQIALLAIPIRIAGLSEGRDVISDSVRVSIKTENGETWTREGRVSEHLENLAEGYRVTMQVDRSVFDNAKGRPVDMTLTLYLTLLGNDVSRVVGPEAGAVEMAGIGRCRDFVADRDNWIGCDSPLREPGSVLLVDRGGWRDRFMVRTSYSPFPADAESALVPLFKHYHSGAPSFGPATLISLKPLAHFRKDLKLEAIHLADYRTL